MITSNRQLRTPWRHASESFAAPRRLTIKITLGDAPDAIPASADVRRGFGEAATTVDGGPIDRILRRHAGHHRVVRVYSSASGLGRMGSQHHQFDDLEHAIGLSRVFRIDLEREGCIHELVEDLRQLERIEYASPQYLSALPFADATAPIRAFDEVDAWAPRALIGAAQAMAHESGDSAVIIAIVDTGVHTDHVELSGVLRAGYDTVEIGSGDVSSGLELLGDTSGADTDPQDEVGHGTACAGIIGASGESIPHGLAGQCGVLPIRVLASARMPGKAEPIGVGAVSDIDAGVKSAIDLGAKIINMSFGTPESMTDEDAELPHQDVVRYGAARGCIMVAASGNTGAEERFSPAALDDVIAVGAVDDEGQPSSFSTRGVHVNVSAPGERIVTSGLTGYQRVTGTSFAAPFVSAAAGLLVSRALRRAHVLDPHTAKTILQSTARPWRRGVGAGGGAGVLDVPAALQTLDRIIDHDEIGGAEAESASAPGRETRAHAI